MNYDTNNIKNICDLNKVINDGWIYNNAEVDNASTCPYSDVCVKIHGGGNIYKLFDTTGIGNILTIKIIQQILN